MTTDEREDRRRDFLLLLVETGDIGAASKAVGFGPRALARERSGDAEFDRLCGDALALAGEPEPNDVVEHSDRRLMFALRVLKPEKYTPAYDEMRRG